MPVRRLVAVVALAGAALLPASAGGDPVHLTLGITAPAGARGWVALAVTGTDGTPITVTETLPGGGTAAVAQVSTTGGRAALPRAAAWRCDRRVRTFTAADGQATARVTVRTPSCRGRLRVSVPRRVAAGRTLAVRVTDRWHADRYRVRVCTTAPGARTRCRHVRAPAVVSTPALRPGRWRVGADSPSNQVRRQVSVRPRGGRLRVLAAGDSEMQLVDEFLARSLGGRAHVHSDARISTGISNTFFFDWVAHAAAQARSLRPDVTVMFIGGNDGFPLKAGDGHSVSCCSRAWSRLFAARTATMIRSYARGGAGRVYWFTLPAPRGGLLRRYFRAINLGYRIAARAHPDDVRLIDAERVFTPHGYRDTMTWRGRAFTIHDPDGYHLSVTGDRIATELVLRAMRRDGML